MKEGQQGPNNSDTTTNVQGCITCVKKKIVHIFVTWLISTNGYFHGLCERGLNLRAKLTKDNVSFQDVHYKNIKVFWHLISGLKHFEDMTSSAFKCK